MDKWMPMKMDEFFRRHPVLFGVVLVLAALVAVPFTIAAAQASVVLYQAF